MVLGSSPAGGVFMIDTWETAKGILFKVVMLAAVATILAGWSALALILILGAASVFAIGGLGIAVYYGNGATKRWAAAHRRPDPISVALRSPNRLRRIDAALYVG